MVTANKPNSCLRQPQCLFVCVVTHCGNTISKYDIFFLNLYKVFIMNRIILDKLDKLKDICKEHHVKELFAFGSVCTSNFNEKSDIDLLVTFYSMDFGDYADNYFSLIEKFEKLFKRKIDLITNKSLSNPYFIKSLEKTKTELYAA